MKKSAENREIWFITGSQHLYGPDTLEQVESNSRQVIRNLAEVCPLPLQFKQLATDTETISHLCREANGLPSCVGVVVWMHTFSPAKMWLAGLRDLRKPLLHFHTQFNTAIPWDSIDMDYMNLHQAAHGGREFGFATSRLRKSRHVIAGHWQDLDMQREFADWTRVALGWAESQVCCVARFGDNMRNVAVTEGDKVEAQIQLGWRIDGYGIDDLYKAMDEAQDQVPQIIEACLDEYNVVPELQKGGSKHQALVESAQIEAGIRHFLVQGGFTAFTTTFENLGSLAQLPGLAVQRLMKEGYGFGAEGDWKTAALLYIAKVIGLGKEGGSSFIEDYTYHFNSGEAACLGAHMLEVCPSITTDKPHLDISPLGIGGRADPVRLLFSASHQINSGRALNTTLLDMGNRFRILTNVLRVLALPEPMPKLPVAHALWAPEPNLSVSARAWIQAGGAHHSCFSQNVSSEQLRIFAEIAGIEFVGIDSSTELHSFCDRLRWNDLYYSQMSWAQKR